MHDAFNEVSSGIRFFCFLTANLHGLETLAFLGCAGGGCTVKVGFRYILGVVSYECICNEERTLLVYGRRSDDQVSQSGNAQA